MSKNQLIKSYISHYIQQIRMGDPQIYVRGFPKYTTQEELRTAFGGFGEIKQVRMIRDYSFIVFDSEQSINKAVDGMNGKEVNNQRVRVQIAGQPKKPKGPQPSDECRLCGRKGHWKNDCPDIRRQRKRRRRSRSASSSSSSSSSSSVKKKKYMQCYERKVKKHKGKSKKRRSSSSSSSSYSSSSSNQSKKGANQSKRGQRKNEDK